MLVLESVLLAACLGRYEVTPRWIAPKQPIVITETASKLSTQGRRLIAKFSDDARARIDAGQLVFRGSRDQSSIVEFVANHRIRFQPLIRLEESKVEDLLARARLQSGEAQPDLLGMMIVEPSSPIDDASLVRLGNELQELGQVEWVAVEWLGIPPPGDIAPPTPNLVANQGYRGPNPGIDALFAHSLGVTGAGIRLSDCEYGWKYAHEDLVDIGIVPEPGQTIAGLTIANGWDEHGTAVLGETSATDNAYGVSGMAGGASVFTYPEYSAESGARRVECITNAIANSSPGDVVLLEMQAVGFGGGYAPAEVDASVYTVVKVGVAAGVVVVGAAGNGNQDLDSFNYASYINKGDSGAIIVGAGSANTNHDKLSFSTYGNRVNLQGWGESVFATGYGSFAQYGGDVNQRYTASFNGTSSASPIVTSACLLVQSFWKTRTGTVLPPKFLRSLLVDTGIPQGSGGKIGPLPNVRTALESLMHWQIVGSGLAGSLGVPKLLGYSRLTALAPVRLVLTQARPLAAAAFVIGASRSDLPFLGGILVPTPQAIVSLVTDTTGTIDLATTVPAGLPSGAKFYLQAWIADPLGMHGAASSNALEITIP